LFFEKKERMNLQITNLSWTKDEYRQVRQQILNNNLEGFKNSVDNLLQGEDQNSKEEHRKALVMFTIGFTTYPYYPYDNFDGYVKKEENPFLSYLLDEKKISVDLLMMRNRYDGMGLSCLLLNPSCIKIYADHGVDLYKNNVLPRFGEHVRMSYAHMVLNYFQWTIDLWYTDLNNTSETISEVDKDFRVEELRKRCLTILLHAARQKSIRAVPLLSLRQKKHSYFKGKEYSKNDLINIKDSNSRTILFYAMEKENDDQYKKRLIDFLYKRGADLSISGSSYFPYYYNRRELISPKTLLQDNYPYSKLSHFLGGLENEMVIRTILTYQRKLLSKPEQRQLKQRSQRKKPTKQTDEEKEKKKLLDFMAFIVDDSKYLSTHFPTLTRGMDDEIFAHFKSFLPTDTHIELSLYLPEERRGVEKKSGPTLLFLKVMIILLFILFILFIINY